jgi:hypothetical protein
MNATRIVSIVLIAIGLLSLVYGGFTYTRVTREAKIGSMEFSWNDRDTVQIPVWLGVGCVVAGSGLLLGTSVRKRG